jgi:CRP/FNR family transcriptional regulator
MKEIISRLEPHSITRTMRKRSIVLFQGEIPREVYIVKSGIVKSYTISSTGEEQILRFYCEGDIFPIPWIYERATHGLNYFETLTDSKLLSINREMFLKHVEDDSTLLKYMNNYLAASFTGSQIHITALEQPRAKEKLLTILWYLCVAYGKEFKKDKFMISLNLTHSMIASLTGLTRETTATELNKFKKLKIINYTPKYYLINKAKLDELLGEDSLAKLNLSTSTT